MRSTKSSFSAVAFALVIAFAGCAASHARAPKIATRQPQQHQQANAPDLRLVINIPASRLDVYEKGEHTHSYDISAGKREFATPPGKYGVREIIWNPWWHPPASEWARKEKAQPPGPENPMGRIKLNFSNLLYMHGTQWEDHLGAPASHGCVRMGDADLLELTHIIHRYRTPRVDPALLSTLEANEQMTRSFPIKPVPLQVVYKLVEVLDDKLVIHPDVYRNAGEDLRADIVSALEDAGVEVTPALESRLYDIAKPRKVTRVSISLDSLLSAKGASNE